MELCKQDLGRPVQLIKSARLPNDVLVVEYMGTYDIPDVDLPTMTEIRLSVFVGNKRATSIIIDNNINRS